MRIISGIKGGHVIQAPKGLPVRPTTDRAKESLFNILANYFDFESLRVVDLFAGTGNISYEFASRGSSFIVAVEKNFNCSRFIEKQSIQLGFEDIDVYRMEAMEYLQNTPDAFDIVFMDPPYDTDVIPGLVEVVFRREVLTDRGFVIAEHPKQLSFKDHPNFYDERKYGLTNFTFFEYPRSTE